MMKVARLWPFSPRSGAAIRPRASPASTRERPASGSTAASAFSRNPQMLHSAINGSMPMRFARIIFRLDSAGDAKRRFKKYPAI